MELWNKTFLFNSAKCSTGARYMNTYCYMCFFRLNGLAGSNECKIFLCHQWIQYGCLAFRSYYSIFLSSDSVTSNTQSSRHWGWGGGVKDTADWIAQSHMRKRVQDMLPNWQSEKKEEQRGRTVGAVERVTHDILQSWFGKPPHRKERKKRGQNERS